MSIVNLEPRFVIVNDADRPCARLTAIAVDPNDYRYLNYKLDSSYRVMHFPDATNIKDFGFEIVVDEYFYLFRRVRPSIAKYRDGKFREWQGEDVFSYVRPAPAGKERMAGNLLSSLEILQVLRGELQKEREAKLDSAFNTTRLEIMLKSLSMEMFSE